MMDLATRRARNNEAYKRKRIRYKQLGLCDACGKPTLLFVYCYACRQKKKRYMNRKAERERRVSENRCPDCGRPKDEDADAGRITCINCRERKRVSCKSYR